MHRNVKDKGELQLRTKYIVQAHIMKIGEQIPYMKCKRRLFIAKRPFNPRINFIEMAQQEVSKCCSISGESRCLWLCSAGINKLMVKFERNFYLSNEMMKAKCFIDNTYTSTVC